MKVNIKAPKINTSFKVERVYPELENLEVTPTIEEQNFKSSKYGFNNVKVKGIETEELSITPSMEEQINEGLFNKVTTKGIESEELTVTPTEEEQIFDGLYNKVTVEALKGEAVKGVFEGEEAELTNSIESAVIEEFGVTGVSVQEGTPTPDAPIEIQNVTGDIVVKVTNGTEEQTATFPLGSQVLRQGDYLGDDGIYATRGKVIFNGTESWDLTARDGYYAFWVRNTTITGALGLHHEKLCTHFPYAMKSFSEAPLNTLCENTIGGNMPMFIFKVDFATTVAEWKTWLASNNVIVEYNLATPEIIPYTTTQQEAWNNIKQLTTYAGTTTITTTNVIKPVLSGEYYMKAPEYPIVVTNVNGTLQIKVEGKNIFNEEYYGDSSLYGKLTNYFAYVKMPDTFKTKFYGNMFLKGTSQALVAGFSNVNTSIDTRILNNATLNQNVEYDFTNAENVYFIIGNPNFISIDTDINTIFNNYNIMVTKEEATEYEPYPMITLLDDQTATITMAESNKTVISLK